MSRYLRISFFGLCSLVFVVTSVSAKPNTVRHQLAEPYGNPDIVGDVDGVLSAPQKAQQDTVWIADWSFDTGAPCDNSGWEKVDNRIQNDGALYWEVNSSFSGTGGIVGDAAALGYNNDVCCVDLDGYDNNWYQAIRIEYSGAGSLSFNYLVDSEAGFDFLQVENDSACSSFDRVDLDLDPSIISSALFRNLLLSDSGFNLNGNVSNLSITDFGTTETHCVYIAFFSDTGFSPCDGLQSTQIGEAIVIDNISLTGVSSPVNEDFSGGLDPNLSFVNMLDDVAFGEWARTFSHITDNDVCSENTTCAWLWTDHTTPTIANDPSMAFGPGSFVIRNWLDDIVISPWISLSSTPTAIGTVIEFRRFPGNFFSTSRIVQNWSVRGKRAEDGTECVDGWGNVFDWDALSLFTWITIAEDMSGDFDPTSNEVQIRHRTSDWQWITGVGPPSPFTPGPGPYIDRTRIGRQVLSGPVINEGLDARFQAQDAFATEIDPTITPGTGEHFRPSIDRFGSAAFSQGSELGINNTSPNLITGDSIVVQVQDVRGAGGLVSVDVFGAITSGPHQGKAPPPFTVGSNGFFVVPADSARTSVGTVVADFFFVDVDDDYFRGGDILHYLWVASDALGGVSSDPIGLSAVPTSIEEAQDATQGMFEVAFLPTINWDSSYLDRIAADPNGKLEPTQAELAGSVQANCLLYYNQTNPRKRSGDINRTSFMYTLDQLGYRDTYDRYFHMGIGNTNNQLGGRATLQQAQGYNLIIYDTGNSTVSFVLTDGSDLDAQKIDQAGWFRNWLAQAGLGEAGFATLWILGSNVAEAKPTNPLLTTDMAVVLGGTDQALNANPDVEGVSSFTFTSGGGTNTVDFSADEFSMQGGCPVVRDYDALSSSGSGVETHRYRDPVTSALGSAAVVMNSNAAFSWNTIFQSHPWFDIRDTFGGAPSSPQPERALLNRILGAVLPLACQQGENPTDTGGDDGGIDAPPLRTALHQNVPNPFNPVTTIRFDLARDGRVSLRIYDAAGRLVRALLDGDVKAGRNRSAVWNGLDENGGRVSSGVYFYRLDAPEFTSTRKMVVVR